MRFTYFTDPTLPLAWVVQLDVIRSSPMRRERQELARIADLAQAGVLGIIYDARSATALAPDKVFRDWIKAALGEDTRRVFLAWLSSDIDLVLDGVEARSDAVITAEGFEKAADAVAWVRQAVMRELLRRMLPAQSPESEPFLTPP